MLLDSMTREECTDCYNNSQHMYYAYGKLLCEACYMDSLPKDVHICATCGTQFVDSPSLQIKICDDCLDERAVTIEVLFTDGLTEEFSAQPENVNTPDKLRKETSEVMILFGLAASNILSSRIL